VGSALLPVEGENGWQSDTRTVQIQGKTLFRRLETNSHSYGLVLGGVVRSQSVADQVANYYAYVPFTRSFGDDKAFLHVNLGAQRSGADPVTSLTYGAGAEISITPRLFVIAEVFGDNHTRQSYQGGVRIWLVPDHVQIDTTVGARAGDIGASRWFTVGLRLISPTLFK
jgi:hypothetical protein